MIEQPIAIREFDGDPPIEDGQPVRERVVYIVPFRTGKMRRMEQNALLKLENGEAVLTIGNQESARAAAAIVSWEGPGLDGVPITVESLDELEYDAFMERVFKVIGERLAPPKAEKGESTGPKAQATMPRRIGPSFGEKPPTSPARGLSSTSSSERFWGGALIKLTD